MVESNLQTCSKDRDIAKVNKCSILSIACIQPADSMAHKMAILKYDSRREEHFTEFDFLAVLKNSIEYYSHREEKLRLKNNTAVLDVSH